MVPDVMSQKETLNRPAIRRELLDCLWCPPTRRCRFFWMGEEGKRVLSGSWKMVRLPLQQDGPSQNSVFGFGIDSSRKLNKTQIKNVLRAIGMVASLRLFPLL